MRSGRCGGPGNVVSRWSPVWWVWLALTLAALVGVACADRTVPGPVQVVQADAAPAAGPVRQGDSPVEGTRGEAAATIREVPTVEELLEHGLHLGDASPVHLAIRGTPAAGSVRCAWRGIARTAEQRADAIRFWLRLGPDAAIPESVDLEILFTVVLDTLDPEYRETAKANFRSIARGGLSEDYRFLTCFADYAVTHYLLGAGPSSVTVAYDRMGEAAAYGLSVREHDAGTFGTAARQSRGAYEAGLQAQVVAAEQALSAEIGGREAVVFLAPTAAAKDKHATTRIATSGSRSGRPLRCSNTADLRGGSPSSDV